MDVKLVAVEGEWRDPGFPIEGSDVLIGRAADCQLQIDHSLVELEHCRIRRDGDHVWVQDLGSTFGTTLNGKKVTEAELRDGDRLRIGPSIFVVSVKGGIPPATAAPTAEEAEAAKQRPRGRAPDEDTPVVESARNLFERLTTRKNDPAEAADAATAQDPAAAAKTRLRVVKEHQGVSVVNLLDRAIIHDHEILEIGQELEGLIDQGKSRVLLDFGNVKHLSSQAVGVLLQAQKRFKSGGGLMKLCNPNPAVAEVFKITNLPRAIEIHADEQHAFQTGWPETPKVVPSEPTTTKPKPTPTMKSASPATGAARNASGLGPVRLVLEVGKEKGKAIKISGSSFLIGRDSECQMRPASSAVSRRHTRIEVREGRVYVRDLGTTNGTLLAHRLLRNAEAEAYNGDLLQIGPLVFRVVFQQPFEPEPPSGIPEDSSWLMQPTNNQDLSDTALFTLPSAESIEEARQRALAEVQHLRYRVSGGDVLVVTLMDQELREEDQVAPIRHELLTLMEKPVPKQVVLVMDQVRYLSSSAIGMLLAHHQRLARAGGGMRFCQVRPELRPTLENQRVSMLVELYPTLEKAVTEPWPIAEGS